MDFRIPNEKHGARPRHQEAPSSSPGLLRRRLALQEDRPPPYNPIRNIGRLGDRNDTRDAGTDRRDGAERRCRNQGLVEGGVLRRGGGVHGKVPGRKPRQAWKILRGGEETLEGQNWEFGEVGEEERVGYA